MTNKNKEESAIVEKATSAAQDVLKQGEEGSITAEEFKEQLPQGLLSRSDPFDVTWDRGKFSYEGQAVNEIWRDGDEVKQIMVRTLVTRQRVKDTSKYNPKECNKAGNR